MGKVREQQRVMDGQNCHGGNGNGGTEGEPGYLTDRYDFLSDLKAIVRAWRKKQITDDEGTRRIGEICFLVDGVLRDVVEAVKLLVSVGYRGDVSLMLAVEPFLAFEQSLRAFKRGTGTEEDCVGKLFSDSVMALRSLLDGPILLGSRGRRTKGIEMLESMKILVNNALRKLQEGDSSSAKRRRE